MKSFLSLYSIFYFCNKSYYSKMRLCNYFLSLFGITYKERVIANFWICVFNYLTIDSIFKRKKKNYFILIESSPFMEIHGQLGISSISKMRSLFFSSHLTTNYLLFVLMHMLLKSICLWFIGLLWFFLQKAHSTCLTLHINF